MIRFRNPGQSMVIKKDTKKIEKILSIKKDKNSRNKVNSSVEESILNKIGK